MNSNLGKKVKNVKIVLTDVDGTLTDGGMYYSSKGDTMKKFHVRDGMAVNILLKNQIHTIVVTKEKSSIVKNWSDEMNVKETFMGIKNKTSVLPKICKKYNVKLNEIAFIGDDVNDLELLEKVGFSAAPGDTVSLVKNSVNYVCSKNGGNGAFRELAELILRTKFSDAIKWY